MGFSVLEFIQSQVGGIILMTKYSEENHIETALDGQLFGRLGNYKYRVLGRDGFPNHHTNDLKDARKWLGKCRAYWVEQDNK